MWFIAVVKGMSGNNTSLNPHVLDGAMPIEVSNLELNAKQSVIWNSNANDSPTE